MTQFWKCNNYKCDWYGPDADILRAEDPFNPGQFIYACPKCRDITLTSGCDEPGCTRHGSCGFPTPAGYRRTCGPHSWCKVCRKAPRSPGLDHCGGDNCIPF